MSEPYATRSVASFAHEYNNLLTVLSGSLALAERHAAGNEALIRLIDHMRAATDRAEVLTRALADASFFVPEDRQPAPAPLPGPAAKLASASRAQGHSVLVVEDNPNVAMVAVAVLESLGLYVALAENAVAALSHLEAKPDFDLVFSDIVMPGGMSGIDLAEVLETSHPHIPVLLATAFSREALGPGAQRFPVLPKPYSVAELSRRVQQMIADGRSAQSRADPQDGAPAPLPLARPSPETRQQETPHLEVGDLPTVDLPTVDLAAVDLAKAGPLPALPAASASC